MVGTGRQNYRRDRQHGRKNVTDIKAVVLGPLARDLPFMIRNLNAMLRPIGVAVREPLGIESGSIGILYMIWVNPGISQNDLAASLAMKKPAVTKLVKRLESEGLLERRRVQGNRRMNALTLTTEGQETVARIRRMTVKLNDQVTEGVPNQDLEVFFRVLEKLHDTLKARQQGESLIEDD